MKASESFSLGAVVVPAVDSVLSAHGYKVEELGDRALGFVIEKRSGKSLIGFPELNVNLWMSNEELADVEFESSSGHSEFSKIIPAPEKKLGSLSMVWLASRLTKMLSALFILSVESGDLIEIFDQEDHPLDHYYRGDINVSALCLSLGVGELSFENWSKLREELGPRLLFSRILPSGMHKFEMALYLRKSES
jgi:hypothetical protein